MSDAREADAIERGCECTDCGAMSRCTGSNAPVAWRVRRDGEEIKVCTRCKLSDDEKLELLVDEETPSGPYADYDSLGLFGLMAEVGDG